jgi:hypothetical protein
MSTMSETRATPNAVNKLDLPFCRRGSVPWFPDCEITTRSLLFVDGQHLFINNHHVSN